jgi:predicted RNase H-like HicB family nuclease
VEGTLNQKAANLLRGGSKMNHRGTLDMEITANIRLEDGSYWADIPALPGCFAAGMSLDELFDSLREGIELYLADDAVVIERPERPLQLTSAVLSDASP